MDRTLAHLFQRLLLSQATATRENVENFRANSAYMHVLHSGMSSVLIDQLLDDISWLDDALVEEDE
jgi:hypothetical protein